MFVYVFTIGFWTLIGGAFSYGIVAALVRYYYPNQRWLWSLSVVFLTCTSGAITIWMWDSAMSPLIKGQERFNGLLFLGVVCSGQTLLGALFGLHEAKDWSRPTSTDAPPAPPIDPIWDSKYAHLVWEHYYRKAAAIYHAHLRAAMTGALTGGQFAGGQVEVNVFVQNALRAAFEAAIQHLVDCGVQRELAAHNLTLMVPTPNIDPLPAEHSDSAEVRGASAESPR